MDKSIMAHYRCLLILCLIAFSFGACSGDKGDDPLAPENNSVNEVPYLNISVPDTISVTEIAGNVTIAFNTNKNWTAASNQQWSVLSTTNGSKGSNTITVKVDSNTDYKKRYATVTIKAESLSKEVVIQQDKLHTISSEKDQYNVSYKGDTLSIELMTNVECEIKSEADWIKVLQDSGTRSPQPIEIRFEIYPNFETQDRSTVVIIGNKEKKLEEKITIIQEGYPYINMDTADTIYVDDKAASASITFSTNKSWSASSSQEWCSLSVSSGEAGTNTVNIAIGHNKDYSTRSAIVKVKAANITKEIIVQQDKLHEISVTKQQYEISHTGDTLSVNVSANTEYEISYSANWIKLLQSPETRSMQSKDWIFAVLPNMEPQERSTVVILCNKEKKIEKKITITQKAYPKTDDGGNPNGNIGNMEWN